MFFSTANSMAAVVIVADVVIKIVSSLPAKTSNDFSSFLTRKQLLVYFKYEPPVLITSCKRDHLPRCFLFA